MWQTSLHHLLTPWPLTLMMLGTALGIVVGAIPGLTGAMAITLALPVTYQLDYANAGMDAMILLVSIYVGSVSGGLISATLLRMPGTPASIMTTLDGHALARDGRPGRALGLGINASFAGGLISWVFLALLAKPMATWSTQLGPFEFFTLVMMAFVLIGAVSGERLSRGVLAGLLGVAAALPGTHPATGQLRLTMGFRALDAGLPLLPVLIGLFAVSQMIVEITSRYATHTPTQVSRHGLFMTFADWKRQALNLVRSSLIGTWIGILPGIGANIGSVVAYSAAKNMSKNADRFGHGSEEAIVASEAANNATVGGALIPLISMGIPGSVIDAILLGALVIHGLQPGPLLFKTHPDVVYTIIGAMLLANCFMWLFMIATVDWLARLMFVPKTLLLPLVFVFCVVGSYMLNHRMFDVGVMIIFGVVGYLLERYRFPLAPFVIGFVLAPIAEENLCAGLMQSGGSYWPIITRPISLSFTIVALALMIWPLARRRRQRIANRLPAIDE